MKRYDLIVIGGGPAGTPSAMEYAKLNPHKKILLIDKKGELGGECLFDGCIPSKILEASGEHLKLLNKLKSFGIEERDNHPQLIWEDIVKKKKAILSNRAEYAGEKLESLTNVSIKKGIASFVNKNVMKIISDKGKEMVSFDNAIIGTGSRTHIPSFSGNGMSKVMTNKEFFDKMVLPKSITIIGTGPIGIELSQILSKLGVQVNLIGNSNKILNFIDEKFSNILIEKLNENKNINLILNANVKEINYKNHLFGIKYYQESQKEINSNEVLIATGRVPNIEKLNLKKANIKYNKKGIIVNKYLQTSNSKIYACGDVIFKGPQFAHTASYEAHIAVQNLFFGKNKVKTNFDKNSWVLFSDPNIVSAGILEKEAKRRNIDIITGIYDYSIDARRQIDNEAFGYLKYVVEKKTLKIIGITIFTVNANAIAGEAALIIANKLTLKDLVDTIQPHPTLGESFTFLAKEMMWNIMAKKMESPLFKIMFFMKKIF